jgi:pimeloyl-ACP methyl ester carboxylesterase
MTDATRADRTILLLHGGGGPATVAPIAAHFAPSARVIAPTLPGWHGTPRPAELDSARAYARHLLRELADAGVEGALVIGSSLGGWIAAELALLDAENRVSGLALLDAVGIEVAEHPIRDITGLAPHELAQFSWHDPSRFVAPEPTPANLAMLRGNQAALAAVAGEPYMCDPGLRERLGAIAVPALVVWGESDGVVTPGYGRAFAEAIPDARFELIPAAGHLPQLENPFATFAALDAFAVGLAG